MSKYAQERKAFGKPIGEFGQVHSMLSYSDFGECLVSIQIQIQKMIAETYSEYMAARHYVYNFANSLDLNTFGSCVFCMLWAELILSIPGNGLDADGVKLYGARMAKAAGDRAIQVLGGNGYTGLYQVAFDGGVPYFNFLK